MLWPIMAAQYLLEKKHFKNWKKSHLSKYFPSYFKNITKGNTYYTIYNLVKL